MNTDTRHSCTKRHSAQLRQPFLELFIGPRMLFKKCGDLLDLDQFLALYGESIKIDVV